jgi:SAM-dependent methyltransferase
MRNVERWQPTKYVSRSGRLRATTDDAELWAGSRLIADLLATTYEDAFKQHASGRLLDVGCGKVPFYDAYRPYVSDIQCIDWANSPHGTSFLDQECDLSGTIPYADASFDTILLSDVLEHLPEPMNCWREMRRLLKPGGKLLLNVPFYYQVHEAPHDYYRYTEFALRRFAETCGFKVERLDPVGGAPEVLADLAGKLLAGAKLKPVAIAMQSMTRWFVGTQLGSRLSQRTRNRFPLGYFMIATKADDAGQLAKP